MSNANPSAPKPSGSAKPSKAGSQAGSQAGSKAGSQAGSKAASGSGSGSGSGSNAGSKGSNAGSKAGSQAASLAGSKGSKAPRSVAPSVKASKMSGAASAKPSKSKPQAGSQISEVLSEIVEGSNIGLIIVAVVVFLVIVVVVVLYATGIICKSEGPPEPPANLPTPKTKEEIQAEQDQLEKDKTEKNKVIEDATVKTTRADEVIANPDSTPAEVDQATKDKTVHASTIEDAKAAVVVIEHKQGVLAEMQRVLEESLKIVSDEVNKQRETAPAIPAKLKTKTGEFRVGHAMETKGVDEQNPFDKIVFKIMQEVEQVLLEMVRWIVSFMDITAAHAQLGKVPAQFLPFMDSEGIMKAVQDMKPDPAQKFVLDTDVPAEKYQRLLEVGAVLVLYKTVRTAMAAQVATYVKSPSMVWWHKRFGVPDCAIFKSIEAMLSKSSPWQKLMTTTKNTRGNYWYLLHTEKAMSTILKHPFDESEEKADENKKKSIEQKKNVRERCTTLRTGFMTHANKFGEHTAGFEPKNCFGLDGAKMARGNYWRYDMTEKEEKNELDRCNKQAYFDVSYRVALLLNLVHAYVVHNAVDTLKKAVTANADAEKVEAITPPVPSA